MRRALRKRRVFDFVPSYLNSLPLFQHFNCSRLTKLLFLLKCFQANMSVHLCRTLEFDKVSFNLLWARKTLFLILISFYSRLHKYGMPHVDRQWNNFFRKLCSPYLSCFRRSFPVQSSRWLSGHQDSGPWTSISRKYHETACCGILTCIDCLISRKY